jgi:hypothetical protein
VLRIFKENDLAAAIALVVFTLLLKARYIMFPPAVTELTDFHRAFCFSFSGLPDFYRRHPGLYVMFSVMILFFFSLYINRVVNRERLFQRKNYLVAFSFILITSFSPLLNVFSMPFVACVLLFMAFSKTMNLQHTHRPRGDCFDIGILSMSAALFYFPAILFFFLFLALLLLLRPFSLEENMAYLLGSLTPVYFLMALLYLLGYWHSTDLLFFHISLPVHTIPRLQLLILTVLSFGLLVYGLFLINAAGIKNSIAVRKKWNAVVLYMIFAIIAGLFSAYFPGVPWILTMAPISIILSQTFLNNKEKYNTFTFYFLLAMVVVIQWLL